MKRTLQRKKKKRLRKHGFLVRNKQNPWILSSRRRKERWVLTPKNSRKAK